MGKITLNLTGLHLSFCGSFQLGDRINRSTYRKVTPCSNLIGLFCNTAPLLMCPGEVVNTRGWGDKVWWIGVALIHKTPTQKCPFPFKIGAASQINKFLKIDPTIASVPSIIIGLLRRYGSSTKIPELPTLFSSLATSKQVGWLVQLVAQSNQPHNYNGYW